MLTASRELADYYEAVVARPRREPKLAANWVMGELAAALNRDGLEIGSGKLPAPRLAGLLQAHRSTDHLRQDRQGGVRGDVGARAPMRTPSSSRKGLRQITDSGAIERAIDEVMAKNPGQLADYRAGKDKLFGFFVGQVMKATGGKANPAQLNELLKKKLRG